MRWFFHKNIFFILVSITGLSYSQSAGLFVGLKNPECREIIEKLKRINSNSAAEMRLLQSDIELMDEAKYSMMGEGYKFVIESVANLMNSRLVPPDYEVAATCDAILENIRVNSTAKPAAEFLRYLQDQRQARQADTAQKDVIPTRSSCRVPQDTNVTLPSITDRLVSKYSLETKLNIPTTPGITGYSIKPELNLSKTKFNLSLLGRPSLMTERFTDADCGCATEVMDQNVEIYGRFSIMTKQNQIKNELNSLVKKSFGEKFQNDFSKNFEDLSYFLNTNAKIFPAQANIEKLQCSSVQDYITSIKSKCGNKSDNDINQRLNDILGTDQQGLGLKLNTIAKDATAVDTGKKRADGTPILYTREDMDGQRRQLLEDLPEMKFLDKIIYKIMSQPKNLEEFSNLIGSSDVQSSLYITLSNKLKENPSLIDEIAGDKKNDQYFIQLRSLITNPDSFQLYDFMNGGLEILFDHQPGLKAMFRSKEEFKKVRWAPNASQSVVGMIEEEKNFLNEDFASRCEELKNNLAEAVCVEEDKILSQVDPKDIDRLVNTKNPEIMTEYANYTNLLCRIKGENKPHFTDINVANLPLGKLSDYSQRRISKESNKEPQDQLTSYMRAHQNDPRFQNYMDQSSRTVASRRSSYNGTGRIGNEILAKNSTVRRFDPRFEKVKGSESYVAKTSGAASQLAAVSEPQSKKTDSTTSTALPATTNPQTVGQSAARSISYPPVIQNDSRERSNLKSAIKDFIGERESSEKVDRLLSNSDTSSLREIERLTQETKKSQDQLAALTKQRDQQQLSEMENRLRELESERAQTVTQLASGKNPSTSERSSGRGPASVPQSQPVDVPRAPSAPQVDLSQSQDLNSPAPIPKKPFVFNGGESTPSVEAKASEASLQLIDYLSQNETEITSLVQVKESGMLYKFKVLENGKWIEKEILVGFEALTDDLKKLIDQKISKSGASGQKLVSIDNEIKEIQRKYSYLSLKNIISNQLRK
jgi:hypothetical protein